METRKKCPRRATRKSPSLRQICLTTSLVVIALASLNLICASTNSSPQQTNQDKPHEKATQTTSKLPLSNERHDPFEDNDHDEVEENEDFYHNAQRQQLFTNPTMATTTTTTSQAQIERQAFVVELLKALHEQYGTLSGSSSSGSGSHQSEAVMQERQSGSSLSVGRLPQLLEAIGADGDMRRLIDWVKNSLNVAAIPEVATQFVVSKLGSVNCPALLQPDKEESLVPRFLLFNEHFVDVPFELSINPTAQDCLLNGKFDPTRKTIIMIHGYLGGYTLIDGLTNIKNRLLDMNRFVSEKAIESFIRTSQVNSSYVFTEDLNLKIRSQLYNVVIVDWFNGANPTPRANYIRAAVNAQVVGRLIARFLSSLIVQCGTPANHLEIVAHSLGCHVSGFTGKAMNAAGHRLGKITHLDPVGLCFGRLFSQPRFRLSPNDALDTQAVHVSLNIFDNPLDGAHTNFLVNGGRDQPGCGNQNEVQNSTTSSVSLLFDPAARFAPCSHLRAFALFEDDHRSEQGQCQFVGYRCSSYERFLAGKCGQCDATNSQCRLMGLQPLSMQFRKMAIVPQQQQSPSYLYKDELSSSIDSDEATNYAADQYASGSVLHITTAINSTAPYIYNNQATNLTLAGANATPTSQTMTTTTTTKTSYNGNESTTSRPASLRMAKTKLAPTSPAPRFHSSTQMFGQPAYFVGGNELARRSDRSRRHLKPSIGRHQRLTEVIERLRSDTRSALTSLRASKSMKSNDHEEDSLGSEDETKALDLNESTKELDDNNLQGDSASEMMSGDGAEEQVVADDDTTTSKPKEAQRLRAATTEASLQINSVTVPSTLANAAAHGILRPAARPTMPSGMPPPALLEHFHNGRNNKNNDGGAASLSSSSSQRVHEDGIDQVPLGSQAIPAGSLNGPLYFLGTSSLSPFCVNYYQFRVLIAESRVLRLMSQNGLASNRLKAQYNQRAGGILRAAAATIPQRAAASSGGRDMVHLTVKLTDSFGHFFKGFSVLESVRSLTRVMNDFMAPPMQLKQQQQQQFGQQPLAGLNEPMVEITMLLNSTSPHPTKISETILSYYFHPILMADRVEINYMSNISPEIRAKYSSIMCPVAINDRHQLVKYIECHKVGASTLRRRKK